MNDRTWNPWSPGSKYKSSAPIAKQHLWYFFESCNRLIGGHALNALNAGEFLFFQGSIDRRRCVDRATDGTRRRCGRWSTATRGTRRAWGTSQCRKAWRTMTSRLIFNRPPIPHTVTAVCSRVLVSLRSLSFWPVACQRRQTSMTVTAPETDDRFRDRIESSKGY